MGETKGPKQQDLGVDEVVGAGFDEAGQVTSGLMVTHQQVRNKYQDGAVDAMNTSEKELPSES